MSTTARAQVMSWGIAASIAACVVLSTASGQEQKTRPTDPDRFEIRSAEAGPPTQAKEEGKPLPDPVMIPASDIVYLTDLGDEPSYAPMEEIRGGPENAVLEIRLRGNPYVLSFTNGDFTPEPGIDPALARRLAHGDKPHTYGFVMIKGRMSREKLKTLQELGVEFLGVHTWQSIKAKIPLTALKGMDALPFVHWVGFARPEQKLQKQLADALQGAAQGQVFEIYVQPFESDLNKDSETREIGETSVVGDLDAGVARAVQLPTREIVPNGPVQKGIEALGFEFDWYIPQIHCFKGRATKAQILKIRDLDYVHTVELYFPAKVGHDHALAMVSQDRIRKTYPGAKVPIGVIDTGIDSSPWHQDFSSKVFLGWQTTTATVFQDGHGHGTHVSGTMFGRGIADRRYTGCVPSVGLGGEGDRIFVGRYLNDSGSGEGNVSTLYTALGQNQTWAGKSNPKPAIVNNSWGGYSSSGFNGADSRARTLDASVWSTNQTYAFCVGNKDGKAGTWAWSPGAAKNALTVGRVTDYGTSTKKPGQPSANSRWNTTDGRIKPEIAAPGEVHTSCLFNTTTGYGNKSGCSMATPTAVGVLASLVDRDTAFQYWPSATKAVTVASAVVDGRPLANGTSSSSAKRGHGIINSYKLNWTNRTTFNPWMGVFTSAGGSTTRTLAVNAGLQAVKIVLSWTEPAASSSATKARLNDLRVYVDAPPYTGNATTGDFTLSSTKDNTIWYTSYATAATNLATKIKGQTIQLKIHAKSMAPSSSARFTLVVFQYFKMPSTSSTYAPTLSTSVDKSYVKPLGTVKLTTSLSAKSTADDFNDARIYLYGPTSWVTTALSRTTDDSLVHNYSGDTAASFPSWPHPRVRTGSAYGMTVGQGTSRRMIWTLRAPSTSGWHSLNPRATYHGTSLLSTFRSVCVDGSRPNTISNLKSTTHPLGGW
ncbi:MAG: S8 family peptidase, partial [Planctomycetota bacterium]